MTGEKWFIYWNEYSSDTYLYGSEITYHKKDDIIFNNLLMPPGTVIKQWYSKTNFQARKIEPALPMIDGESDYRIIINIDTPQSEYCLIRLIFYDRYEEEISSMIIRDKAAGFKCPIKTYSYCMQLINGGVTQFNFHSIIIQEVINETSEEPEKAE